MRWIFALLLNYYLPIPSLLIVTLKGSSCLCSLVGRSSLVKGGSGLWGVPGLSPAMTCLKKKKNLCPKFLMVISKFIASSHPVHAEDPNNRTLIIHFSITPTSYWFSIFRFNQVAFILMLVIVLPYVSQSLYWPWIIFCLKRAMLVKTKTLQWLQLTDSL